MRLHRVWALAIFEWRLARRRWRTWLLGVTVLAVGGVLQAGILFQRVEWSGFTARHAVTTPGNAILLPLWGAGILASLVGIFGVFDWRHREEAVHFADTLDASALSRHEHAWGSYLGQLPAVLWPLVVLLAGQAVAIFLTGEPYTAGALVHGGLLLAVLSASAFTALAFGLAGWTGSRALGLLLPTALLVAQVVSPHQLPEGAAVALAAITQLPLHSDFVGTVLPDPWWWQRLTLLACVPAAVSAAACGRMGLPRSGRHARRAGALAVAWTLTILAGAFASWSVHARLARHREAVLASERALAIAPRPRLVRRDLTVELEPGRRRLSATTRLSLRNDGTQPLEEIWLRLNAGMTIEAASVDGREARWRRDGTAVVIAPAEPLAPGQTVWLETKHSGSLDRASIDAEEVLVVRDLDQRERLNRRLLGTVPGFLEPGAVVLGIDAGWHPEPGARLGHRYPNGPVPALAPGRLEVHAPRGWRVASVGRREEGEAGAHVFTTEVDVPGFPLVAGPYEERTLEVDGLELRLLHHPRHADNVELFAETSEKLVERVQDVRERLGERLGIDYPHPTFTLVEVPQPFATHGGSWESPNRLAQPGTLLVREGWFFQARFEEAIAWRKRRFEEERGGVAEGGDGETELSAFDVPQAKFEVLVSYGRLDPLGGDPERQAFRSVWDHRVNARGAARPILGRALGDFLFQVAATRRKVEGPSVLRLGRSPFPGDLGGVSSSSVAVIDGLRDHDEVRSLLAHHRLDELGPCAVGRLFEGVLDLKGHRPLWMLRFALGLDEGPFAETTAALLAAAGDGELTWDEFRASVLAHLDDEHREPMGAYIDGWLEASALPGFVVPAVTARRLVGGDGRWQVLAHVENAGEAEGLGVLFARAGDDTRWQLVRVSAGGAVEVGVVLDAEPENWWLYPAAALNTDSLRGTPVVREGFWAGEALEGTRPADVRPAERAVVVDDLDSGFAVQRADGSWSPHVVPSWTGCDEAEASHRPEPLPAFRRSFTAPSRWSRWRPAWRDYQAHGLFDATLLVKRGAEGRQAARWRAELPGPGTYRVEAWLAFEGSEFFRGGRRAPAQYRYVIRHAEGEATVALQLRDTVLGWNDLGRHRFAGSAEVLLRDAGEDFILADAVRFVPLDAARAAAASSDGSP